MTLLLMISCRKEIPFNAEEVAPKIVVNSLFSTDSIWSAHIGRSAGILDTADYSSIPDATAFIYDADNNQVAELLYQGNGLYTDTTSMPIENQEYRIEISAPGFQDISASNAIPSAVPIIALDTLTATNEEGLAILQVDVVIDDPANINNYYLIEMWLSGEYQWGGITYEYSDRMEISSNDPYIETTNTFDFDGFENAYNYFLLSDENFDGEDYTLSFSVINWEDVKKDVDLNLFGEIRLLNSSEAFYNYRTSYEVYDNANGNPFATPVQVYSNINNGIGIFAGGTLTTWEVEF